MGITRWPSVRVAWGAASSNSAQRQDVISGGVVAILDAGTGKSFLLTTVYSGRVGNPEG